MYAIYEKSLSLQNESSGVIPPFKGSRPLVKSLDPDSILREGQPLHDLDQVSYMSKKN